MAEVSYLARLIAELEAEAEAPDANATDPFPHSLPLTAIETLPKLFQVREVHQYHVEDIARALRDGALVPPLVVLRVGSRVIVVDGHHRLEAHIRSGIAQVPVVAFMGTVREAVLEACAFNSVTKQPMTMSERQDAAWRYVLLGQYSKARIAKAANCSERTVANMRAVKVRLGPEAGQSNTWSDAMRKDHSNGRNDQTDDEREEWIEATAQRHADLMAKTFGGRLAANPEIAARALAIHFGRRMVTVWEHLHDHIPDRHDGDY